MTRSIFILLCTCFLTILFTLSVRSEEIKDFESEIRIQSDGTILVREDIEYDFKYAERHGIFRDIPYNYDYGYKRYSIKLDVADVTNFSGDQYKYSISRSGGM